MPSAESAESADEEVSPEQDEGRVLLDSGEYVLAEDAVELQDGSFVRRQEACLTYGGDCGAWYLRSDCTQLHDGRWACEDDPEVVELTDGGFALEHEVVDDGCLCEDSLERDGDYLCQSCYDSREDTYQCHNCEAECNDEYRDRNDDVICRSCYRGSGLVVDYSDKSSIDLPAADPKGRQFGIELEVVSRDTQKEGAEFVRSVMPSTYCVLKRDGSLPPSGFEIVSRWDSLPEHKKAWGLLLDADPNRKLKSWDTDCCGMHVHVARSGLSPLQMGKMLCLLNESRNAALVRAIAGRDCELGSYSEIDSQRKVSDIVGHRHKIPRSSALNVTSFSCEFRLFKGTITRERFLRNLEFVDAVTSFCAPAGRSIDQATSGIEFGRWVKASEHPLLHKFLTERGFITKKEG